MKNDTNNTQFYVSGYDKDADVQSIIASAPDKQYAQILAKALVHYHENVRNICRKENGEPFDWFEIAITNKAMALYNKTVMVFTKEHPDGIDPEELKKEVE